MKNNYLNILLLSGSGIIGGLLNYIYHPIVLQYISLEEFGVFGSLVGLLNILGIIAVGIILFLNKEISAHINDKEKIKYIFSAALKILGLTGVCLYFIFMLLSPALASYLKIENPLIVNIVGLSIIFSFIGISMDSTLRGLKRFHIIGIITILSPLVKLLVGLTLVILGTKLYGAIIGFLAGAFFTITMSFIYISHYFKNVAKTGNTQMFLGEFKKSKKEIFHFFLVSLSFAILMNIDVIFVKNIFSDSIAGGYAGISILGKFLIFLLLSIETVYYSQIMEHIKTRIPTQLIRNPIIIISIAGVSALIINIFIGEFILKTIKPELGQYSYIYIISLIYYTLLAYISFFSKILIGLGKYNVNYVLLFFIIILTSLVYTVGKVNLEYFIYSFIVVGLLCSITLGILLKKHLQQGK